MAYTHAQGKTKADQPLLLPARCVDDDVGGRALILALQRFSKKLRLRSARGNSAPDVVVVQ